MRPLKFGRSVGYYMAKRAADPGKFMPAQLKWPTPQAAAPAATKSLGNATKFLPEQPQNAQAVTKSLGNATKFLPGQPQNTQAASPQQNPTLLNRFSSAWNAFKSPQQQGVATPTTTPTPAPRPAASPASPAQPRQSAISTVARRVPRPTPQQSGTYEGGVRTQDAMGRAVPISAQDQRRVDAIRKVRAANQDAAGGDAGGQNMFSSAPAGNKNPMLGGVTGGMTAASMPAAAAVGGPAAFGAAAGTALGTAVAAPKSRTWGEWWSGGQQQPQQQQKPTAPMPSSRPASVGPAATGMGPASASAGAGSQPDDADNDGDGYPDYVWRMDNGRMFDTRNKRFLDGHPGGFGPKVR